MRFDPWKAQNHPETVETFTLSSPEAPSSRSSTSRWDHDVQESGKFGLSRSCGVSVGLVSVVRKAFGVAGLESMQLQVLHF